MEYSISGAGRKEALLLGKGTAYHALQALNPILIPMLKLVMPLPCRAAMHLDLECPLAERKSCAEFESVVGLGHVSTNPKPEALEP